MSLLRSCDTGKLLRKCGGNLLRSCYNPCEQCKWYYKFVFSGISQCPGRESEQSNFTAEFCLDNELIATDTSFSFSFSNNSIPGFYLVVTDTVPEINECGITGSTYYISLVYRTLTEDHFHYMKNITFPYVIGSGSSAISCCFPSYPDSTGGTGGQLVVTKRQKQPCP